MTSHRKARTRVYHCWMTMRDRVRNPNREQFERYGGRGITLCERWQIFENFYADMGDPPPGMSIERKDNSKGYEPGNCVWADRKTQGRNKRNNHLLTVDGVTKPLSAWAEETGLHYTTLYNRVTVLGWSPEDAVKTHRIPDGGKRRRGTRVNA